MKLLSITLTLRDLYGTTNMRPLFLILGYRKSAPWMERVRAKTSTQDGFALTMTLRLHFIPLVHVRGHVNLHVHVTLAKDCVVLIAIPNHRSAVRKSAPSMILAF